MEPWPPGAAPLPPPPPKPPSPPTPAAAKPPPPPNIRAGQTVTMDEAVVVSYAIVGDGITFKVTALRKAEAVAIGIGRRMVDMTACAPSSRPSRTQTAVALRVLSFG